MGYSWGISGILKNDIMGFNEISLTSGNLLGL